MSVLVNVDEYWLLIYPVALGSGKPCICYLIADHAPDARKY